MATTRDASGALLLGGQKLADVVSDPTIGTPTYVYDLDAIAAEARAMHAAFDGAPHHVAYAVKANTAGPIVRRLAREGCGADVVSAGELLVALGCGIAPDDVVFSGVAKGSDEIDRAIHAGTRGIGAIQAESVEELARIEARARAAGRQTRVSIRVNPAVERDLLDTHHHIATGHDEAKFGVPRAEIARALDALASFPHLELVGISAHVGSQFTSIEPYVAAARVVFDVARDIAAKRRLAFVDTGGGFGIDYGAGCPVAPADFIRAARVEQRAFGLDGLALKIEPGRSLVAAHGVLVARVLQPKVVRFGGPEAPERRWLLVDAGMNDLLRPALYQARHRIVPLEQSPAADAGVPWRVVGPVCESSDDFGEHVLPEEAPAAVALLDAGAYGYTMASRYNGRPLPAEVFLEGGEVRFVSRRKPLEDWVEDRIAVGR
jgi:diaminopimelate decarboxylase